MNQDEIKKIGREVTLECSIASRTEVEQNMELIKRTMKELGIEDSSSNLTVMTQVLRTMFAAGAVWSAKRTVKILDTHKGQHGS